MNDLKKLALIIENGIVNPRIGGSVKDNVTATITINKSDLNKVSLKEASFADLLKSKAIKIDGDQNTFTSFLGKIASFNFWFNIVEP